MYSLSELCLATGGGVGVVGVVGVVVVVVGGVVVGGVVVVVDEVVVVAGFVAVAPPLDAADPAAQPSTMAAVIARTLPRVRDIKVD